MAVSAAVGAIRAALQGFPFFLITDHTSDDKRYRASEKQPYNYCAHFFTSFPPSDISRS